MKCDAIVLLLVLNAGCSSSPPAVKAKNERADASQTHWDGTTSVLRNYRFPNKKTVNGLSNSDSRKGDPKR